jgi:cell surface protein SprA
MTSYPQLLAKLRIYLLLLTSIFFSGFLHAEGLQYQYYPPDVVPLFEPAYLGVEQYFTDSTLFKLSYSRFTREISLDSTQNHILIEESFYDTHYRLPIMVDVEYYVQERLKFENRARWRESLRKTQKLTEATGGSGIELNIPVKIKSKAFKRIFGGDRVGLRVTGNISFELAGRSESREGSAVSSIEQRGNFTPKFKQTQQFRVEGRVGDKVTVSVDQNSEATFDFENTLKLTYDGDEDEIVQKIEAGNINLSLPSTNYVSTGSNHQGLFGLKTEMRVGNFNFTGIASLERGENQTLSLTGGAREQTFRIKDYEYIRDRYFFVDSLYRDRFEQDIDEQQMILVLDSSLFIRQLDVWKTALVGGIGGGTSYNETVEGLAGIDPSVLTDTTQDVPGKIEVGRFRRLTEGVDYDYDYQRGYFWLKSQPSTNEVIAIAYRTNTNQVGELFQDIDTTATDSTPVKFKLIKSRAPNPSYEHIWSLSMRNVYNLGASGLSADGFDARVIFAVTGEDQEVDPAKGKTYNNLMGLDRLNEQGDVVAGGDKKIDLGQRFIFDLANGYLIFPSRTPFAPTNTFTFDPDRYVQIYNTNDRTFEQQESKFDIEVKTSSTSTTFDLGFNVLEGSEKVTLNGRLLTKDRDYTIDYFSGTLDITASEARRADAQVDIEYERGALFQLDKKTLLGGRLEYQFGERNFVGLTALYYSKSTLDQRVRLGQEPLKNFIWDINTALHFKPNFLSKIFDALPIVETSAESNLKIEAEYSEVRPNPNTFNEKTLDDNDGVAYIDDFEGSKRFTSLGIQYRIWSPASVPMRFRLLSDPTIDYGPSGNIKDYVLGMDRKRAQFNWFNPFDQVPTISIWPDRDVTAQSGTTTNVLVLRWRNDEFSADSAWAGVMRSTANFPDQKKTKFIELWVRGKKGQLNIDLGKISEDHYVKGRFPDPNSGILEESYNNLNNEDINFNGLLDEGEDTGIDGVAGRDGDNVLNDAGDDDWAEPRATQPEFARINGTENNGQAQGARYPDSEDLDGDGSLNRFNDYFEYNFDLGDPDNSYLVSQTFFNDGTPTGWKLYRIPIKDYDFKVGDPDTTFQQIFTVRLWVNNIKPKANDYDTVLVATFDFVGNEWEETGIDLFNNGDFVVDDEKFSITVYNTDEHTGPPANYTSPPNVEGIKDRITQAVSKEQSLVMQLKELPRESRAEARKQFREKINMLNYKRMKMFVYGNRLLPNDSLVFYIRFGPTDRVYYEYREKISTGWVQENEIEIDFEELAKTKDEQYQINANVPDSLNELPVYRRRDPNFPNKEFYVVGTPGLHNINYIVIGAINRGERDLIDREIWLDELRLTGVDRQSGTAMRLLTDLSIADIATVRAQWELVDDNFRRLEQQFASTNGKDMTREKQSYFASLRLNKFMPEGWGLEIPVDAKYTRSRDVPKYFYNSDRPTNYDLSSFTDRIQAFFGVNQEPDSLLNDQIYFTESKSVGGTIRRRDRPRDPWLLRLTVNQLVMDADYSTKHSTSPTDEYADNNSLSGRLSYKIPFGKDNYIRPFGWLGKSWFLKPLSGQKLYYLPSSASANFTISDNESVRKNRLEEEDPEPNINLKTTEKFSIGYKLTESIIFDFNRDYLHDPRLKEQDSTDAEGNTIVKYEPVDTRAKDALNNIFTSGDFGTVKRISQRFGANWTPKIANWLSPSYRYNSNFIYSLDRPQINARSSSLTINHNIRVDLKLATLLEKIYKPKPKGKTPAGGARGARGGRGSSQSPGKDNEEGKDDEKDKEKSGKGLPIPLNPALWVWHILYSFKSATIDFKKDDSYAHANLTEVPGLKYQFGFETDPYQKDESGNSIVDTTFRKVVVAPNIRNTRGIDGSMQVDIIQNLKTSLKYNYQKVDNLNNEQRTQSTSNTVFFIGEDPDNNQEDWWEFIPDWRLSLSGVEKLPLLNVFARTASLEHARSGKFTESSRYQGENQNRDQWSYSNNYQPFLGLTVNTIWGITASVRNNSSVSYDYRSAGATTRREQSGFNFSASYSVTKGFRIPLPFLKKKELKNEIQFSLAFDKTSNKNFSKSITDTEFQELDVSDTWKLRPSITYRFSQKVNGTAFYEQSKSSNKRTGTTTYKEFGINVNIAIR